MSTMMFMLILLVGLAASALGAFQSGNLFSQLPVTMDCNIISTMMVPAHSVGQENTICTFACLQASTESCKCEGWTHSGGLCHLCLECPGGGATSQMNSSHLGRVSYPTYYNQECTNIQFGVCYMALFRDFLLVGTTYVFGIDFLAG